MAYDFRINALRYGVLKSDAEQYYTGLDNVLNADIGQITSRDQIIDPYSLVNSSLYRNTAKGRRQYESDLEQAKRYAELQEAAYKEWYDSEEQQVERQREIGLNPDLIGINSEQATTEMVGSSDTVPGASAPTDGAIAGTVIGAVGTVASVLSSVVTAGASLAALPFTIGATVASAKAATAQAGLTSAQEAATKVATAKALEGNYFNDISGLLATAKDKFISSNKDNPDASFDVDSWLADESNFEGLYEAYAPAEHPMYRAAYNRAFKQVSRLKGSASKIGSETAVAQSEFMQALANPYYDTNELYQLAALEPVYQAMEKLRLLKLDYDTKLYELKNPELAASAENAQNKYHTDYFNNFSGDDAALYDMMLKQSSAIISDTDAAINQHYRSIWEDKSRPFTARAGALYQLQGGISKSWADWLVSYTATLEIQAAIEEGVGDTNTATSIYNKGFSPTSPGSPLSYRIGQQMMNMQ